MASLWHIWHIKGFCDPTQTKASDFRSSSERSCQSMIASATVVTSSLEYSALKNLLKTWPIIVFRCLHGTAPPYLANELCRVADIDARRRLRSASTSALVTLHRASGTVCHPVSLRQRHLASSSAGWRHIFLLLHSTNWTALNCAAPVFILYC